MEMPPEAHLSLRGAPFAPKQPPPEPLGTASSLALLAVTEMVEFPPKRTRLQRIASNCLHGEKLV